MGTIDRGPTPPVAGAWSPKKRQRPNGLQTRGKTAPNRLRRLDMWLVAHERSLLTRRDGAFRRAPFVDVGYGRTPGTTLESAERFRLLQPNLPVFGVEIDRQRVLDAQPHCDAHTQFVEGGFELPLPCPHPPRLIRAMNVLRQYPEDAAPSATSRLGARLAVGGLLVEGTSDPTGRLLTANLHRRTQHGLRYEGLLLSVRLWTDFRPTDMQPVLPKNLIHRVAGATPVAALFASWQDAWRKAEAWRAFGPSQVFVAAAVILHRGDPTQFRRPDRWTRRGYALWTPPTR